MARDVSRDYLKKLNFPNLAHLHLLILFNPIIKKSRKFLRRFYRSKFISDDDLRHCRIGDALESGSEFFQENRWAYLNNIVTTEFHKILVAHWPSRIFLDPPARIMKSWDAGLKWNRGDEDPQHLNHHPPLRRLFDYFNNSDMGERISRFVKTNSRLRLNTFMVTSTYPGSLVIPHRDDTFYTPHPREAYSMLLFVDGAGGTDSGGLSVMSDNEFKDIIFEPPILQNTALIFDVKAPLYHGFKPVQWGKYRKALIIEYTTQD